MKLFVILALLVSSGVQAQTVWKSFRGMCDASAMEMLDDDLFVAGNDEDNVLRVYSRKSEGLPVQNLDFAGFYRLRKSSQEIDLEGSARVGDRIYWISSHGTNAKGKQQPSRHRFFATQVFTNNGMPALRPVGFFCATLLRDLLSDPRAASLGLAGAARKAPKDPGGLNIEGLAATPEGRLLIGFRNPIPQGKALLVPLLNPKEVTEGQRGRFGEPLLLDLGGYGIRSIVQDDNGYLIVAGSFDGGGSSRLYRWDGKASTAKLVDARLAGNPEGIAVIRNPQGQASLFVLSDDGTRKIAGQDCKKLKNPLLKSFRGYELPLPL